MGGDVGNNCVWSETEGQKDVVSAEHGQQGVGAGGERVLFDDRQADVSSHGVDTDTGLCAWVGLTFVHI